MPERPDADEQARHRRPDLLEAVLETLDTGVGVMRAPDFRFEVANPACQRLVPGRPLLGRTLAEVAPELAGTLLPLLRQVAGTGQPFRAVDMRLDLAAAPGGALEERYFTFTYQWLPPDRTGQPAVLAAVTDTTAHVLARRALEASLDTERSARRWLERFRGLSTALAAARTSEEVARATLEQGLAAFGADAGWLVGPDGPAELRVLEALGYDQAHVAPWASFPVAADVPIAEAFRTGRAVFLEDSAALAARYPALATQRSGWQGLAALPMVAGGTALGVLGLSFRAPRAFDEAERARCEWLAQKCAQALERARLSDAERRARRWLERLQAATAAASAAATPEAVADEVIRAGLHALGAASVVVFAREPDGSMRVMATHGLPSGDLDRLSPMPEDARMPAAEAARQGQPIFLGSPEAQVARFPALAGLETTREQRALAVLPLLARGQVVGVLRVGFHEPRRFDEAERSFLESLASQAGLALERARGYQAEQRARAEASRVGVLQERLLAVVGHDLRTPLTAITMSAAMLQRRGGLTPDQAVAVARIDQGAARMAALIQDLLDLSRVRQGLGLALRPGQADLAALAREAVHEQEAAGEPGRMALSAEGDTVLAGDGARLAQVLSNLLGNALRHGAGTPVRVSLLGREDEVVLRVENGGPPIPAALLPHVFEPFRHGGGAGASVGLGLFIVHEIVRAHGGEVAVRSDAAEGTCVTVRLPRGGPGRDGTSAERRARGAPARSPVRR